MCLCVIERVWCNNTEIAGSNPTGGTDVCLFLVFCVVSQRSIRGADHSSRGVLRSVCVCVCLCVIEMVWCNNTEIAGSNPTGGTDVCCECFVLSVRGLYVELITRPGTSYGVYMCVCVCLYVIERVWCNSTEIAGSNPTGGTDVCFECCVLSVRGLYVGLITRPGESYGLCMFVRH